MINIRTPIYNFAYHKLSNTITTSIYNLMSYQLFCSIDAKIGIGINIKISDATSSSVRRNLRYETINHSRV